MTPMVDVKEEYSKLTATSGIELKVKDLMKTAPALYDSKGVLIKTQQDICDCNNERCNGCFVQCKLCKSLKCGHICRSNRKWRYKQLLLNDGAGAVSFITENNGNDKEM